MMSKLNNVIRYWKHYGTRSLLGHSWEIFIINPYRFRMGYQRKVPVFPQIYMDDLKMQQNIINKDKLNICYLIHYFYPAKHGGTERFVLNLAHQQQKLGNNPIVITLGNESLDQYDRKVGQIYYRTYYYEGVLVYEIRHKKAPLGIYYKEIHVDDSALTGFADYILSEQNIDIVHLAYPQPFYSFAMTARKKRIPVVLTGTDFNLFCHYATMVTRKGDFCDGSQFGNKCKDVCFTYGCPDLKKRFQKAANYLTNVQKITVPSKFVANVFLNEFSNINVQVVSHGIDARFNSERKRTTTRKFIYAGTLSELKGVHLLIAAFEQLEGSYQLEIYGSVESDYAKQLMQTKDSRIVFKNAVKASKMPEIYNNADCVIVPSIWYETYNFVVREALTCGCLVVASEIGAMPEAIVENKNGFLFNPGDKESLLMALKLSAEFDWKQYKQAMFPTVEEEGRVYSQIYHELING